MSKLRLPVTIALVAFVVATVSLLAVREARRGDASAPVAEVPPPDPPPADARPAEAPATQADTAPADDAPAARVESTYVVYYFHGDARCASCRRIEAWTFEAVRNAYADDVGEGRVVLRPVNVEQPGNRHYVRDYQLYTKTVVLAEQRGGRAVRHTKLDRVWNLLRDRDAFHRYVRAALTEFMEG